MATAISSNEAPPGSGSGARSSDRRFNVLPLNRGKVVVDGQWRFGAVPRTFCPALLTERAQRGSFDSVEGAFLDDLHTRIAEEGPLGPVMPWATGATDRLRSQRLLYQTASPGVVKSKCPRRVT